MTAREFQRRLGRIGIPEEPVAQLTKLFESVRYGSKETGPEEERLALRSLSAIVSACEATA
jgi:hypothetical protein